LKKVGIFYHPLIEAARPLIARLSEIISQHGASCWTCSAWEAERAQDLLADTELILSIGGDGTILRAARAIAPRRIPILGINLGKLGFMTLLSPEEATSKLPRFLAGEGYMEERTMLRADYLPQARAEPKSARSEQRSFHALNDVYVGRGHSSRAVQIKVTIDGELLATYRADGVIVATATGSTAYSLAAGGPILPPRSSEILLQPVAPHLSLNNALVLPPDTTIQLAVTSERDALLSVDGQIDIDLKNGDIVKVRRSHGQALFLNDKPPAFWYRVLMKRLQGRSNAAST
jgi:NAD+ kinase